MTETRKIAVILVADVVGYSRLMGADEEATLAHLRTLRGELFNPTIEAHGGRVVKRTGDGVIVEFRSVVEATPCALDVTRALAERNEPLPPERRIEVRTGIHLGVVVEEPDGDLLGDAVNIAARLESICEPGGICLSEDASRQVRDKLPETFVDVGERQLKNIVRPMRVYALGGAVPAPPPAIDPTADGPRAPGGGDRRAPERRAPDRHRRRSGRCVRQTGGAAVPRSRAPRHRQGHRGSRNGRAHRQRSSRAGGRAGREST